MLEWIQPKVIRKSTFARNPVEQNSKSKILPFWFETFFKKFLFKKVLNNNNNFLYILHTLHYNSFFFLINSNLIGILEYHHRHTEKMYFQEKRERK